MIGADGEENIPHREWLIAFDRVVNEVLGDLVNCLRGDEFIGAKVHLPIEPFPVCALITSIADHLQCLAQLHS